jgi:hypothetical protein
MEGRLVHQTHGREFVAEALTARYLGRSGDPLPFATTGVKVALDDWEGLVGHLASCPVNSHKIAKMAEAITTAPTLASMI